MSSTTSTHKLMRSTVLETLAVCSLWGPTRKVLSCVLFPCCSSVARCVASGAQSELVYCRILSKVSRSWIVPNLAFIASRCCSSLQSVCSKSSRFPRVLWSGNRISWLTELKKPDLTRSSLCDSIRSTSEIVVVQNVDMNKRPLLSNTPENGR
jgi:hypothetical protein